MHKISTILYVIGFVAVPTIQTPEILRYLIGPFDKDYCYGVLLLKNTIKTIIILGLDVNIIARYVITVKVKNPSGIKDGFWIRFILIWVIGASLLINIVYYFENDYKPILYYVCCNAKPGQIPIKNLGAMEAISIAIHLILRYKNILRCKFDKSRIEKRTSKIVRFVS